MNQLKGLIDSPTFSFTWGLLGTFIQALLGDMSFDGSKLSSATKQAFGKKIFKTGSIELAKDIEKQMKEQADKIRSGSAGGVSSAIGGLSSDSQEFAKERMAKAVEELGKVYPASVQRRLRRRRLCGRLLAATVYRGDAFAETEDEDRRKVALMALSGQGGKALQQKMEEIQKKERINKKLEDVKASGNEWKSSAT